MKKASVVFIVLILSLSSCSVNKVQETNDPKTTQKSEEIKVVVEDLPTFQGGNIKKFEAWVQENVEYPQAAKEKGIEGDVFIMFVVEPDGSLSNINIMRGVDPALDNEAIKVVKSSPKWEYQNRTEGQAAIRLSIKVEFKIK
ncbi:MAG: energy transducer TonB [Bacteroidales bacterium]|nr:energy transducer TonB [Bacteroidales bacterium]